VSRRPAVGLTAVTRTPRIRHKFASAGRQDGPVPPIYAHDPFLRIQAALSSPWLDLPMAMLSISCEGWSLILIALVVVWRMERTQLRGVFRMALPTLIAMGAAALVSLVCKHLLNVPRPLTVLGAERVHLVLEPLGHLSFPSGHSAAAAALATTLSARYGWRMLWVWPFAFLGGLARVYVGAHWGIDVGVGWVLGVSSGLVVVALMRRRARLRDPSGSPATGAI
jgi:undecaprenyl-diphosphatase